MHEDDDEVDKSDVDGESELVFKSDERLESSNADKGDEESDDELSMRASGSLEHGDSSINEFDLIRRDLLLLLMVVCFDGTLSLFVANTHESSTLASFPKLSSSASLILVLLVRL